MSYVMSGSSGDRSNSRCIESNDRGPSSPGWWANGQFSPLEHDLVSRNSTHICNLPELRNSLLESMRLSRRGSEYPCFGGNDSFGLPCPREIEVLNLIDLSSARIWFLCCCLICDSNSSQLSIAPYTWRCTASWLLRSSSSSQSRSGRSKVSLCSPDPARAMICALSASCLWVCCGGLPDNGASLA